MICTKWLGGGGLEPGIYCSLNHGHSGEHKPPAPVSRNKEHRHPFAPGELCWVCDRCGNRVAFDRGHCANCADWRAFGAPDKPPKTHCTCGAPYET